MFYQSSYVIYAILPLFLSLIEAFSWSIQDTSHQFDPLMESGAEHTHKQGHKSRSCNIFMMKFAALSNEEYDQVRCKAASDSLAPGEEVSSSVSPNYPRCKPMRWFKIQCTLGTIWLCERGEQRCKSSASISEMQIDTRILPASADKAVAGRYRST